MNTEIFARSTFHEYYCIRGMKSNIISHCIFLEAPESPIQKGARCKHFPPPCVIRYPMDCLKLPHVVYAAPGHKAEFLSWWKPLTPMNVDQSLGLS